MTAEEKIASARAAREARAAQPKKRRRRIPRGELKAGDTLPRLTHSRGIVGVRKMAVGVLQQQIDAMKNRVLSADDREFLIEVVKALVVGEKVQKTVGNGGGSGGKGESSGGTPLPPLEAKT